MVYEPAHARERLAALLGDWSGGGRGEFPTIEPFDYAESLTVSPGSDGTSLIYQQSTGILDADGRPVRRSHWEAGTLRVLEDGMIELACVQGGGRLEVLRGRIDSTQGEGWSLRLESLLVGNDARVRQTRRLWRCAGDRLDYEMSMATSAVETLTFHVAAQLQRVRSGVHPRR